MDERRKPIQTSSVDGIIGYRLRRAQLAVFGRFVQRFADVDLKPADYSSLVLIADNPGLRPSEIAAVLGIQRANFVSLAGRLESRGLVERHRRTGDRRAHALELTSAGRELVDRLRRLQEAFEAELVAELGGEDERDRLLDLLARIG